jgi:hypothetical protein
MFTTATLASRIERAECSMLAQIRQLAGLSCSANVIR